MGKYLTALLEQSRQTLLDPGTWKSAIAEIIGTSVLVAIGCGSCIGKDWETNNPTIVQISFTFGLTVATVVTCIGHISGGHINPAVTVAMVATRKMTPAKGFVYVLAQLIGAIIGSALLKAITPPHFEGDLGQTTISNELRPFPEGVVVEGLITFALVLTVFASCDGGRSDLCGSVPLGIGLCVVFCHMFAIKYTGSCLNPARSFGPAVVAGNWENHWVYWIGPILGGLVAGIGYELVLATDASLDKTKRLFTDPGYGASHPQKAEKVTHPMKDEQSEPRDHSAQDESSRQL